jgi:hypothetical protein
MALEVIYVAPYPTFLGVPVAHGFGIFGFVQGLGLIVVCDPAVAYSTFYMQMDGTIQGPRSGWNGIYYAPMIDLRKPNGIALRGEGVFRDFDYRTCLPGAIFLSPGGFPVCQVITPDGRYLYFASPGFASLAVLTSNDGVTFTLEYTFDSPTRGDTCVTVSRGRSPTEVCSVWNSGKVLFYDVALKAQPAQVPMFVVDSFDACYYVPKWNVFWVYTHGVFQIVAPTPAPATLSNPDPVDAIIDAVEAGHVSHLRVQCLGSDSEPCIGELINWSITSGAGFLAEPQSATDDSGYALNKLVIPIGASGSVDVHAELDF